VVLHKRKILARRVSPQQKKNPPRRKRKKKEQGTKGEKVKPHLPIQGHEKLHEKRERERERERENFKTSRETF
jgi:hypothetical protein